MKTILKSLLAGAAGLLLLAYVAPAFGADLVTITGQGTCGKCALHETAKCQNVIQKTEDGKTVNYYCTGDVSKEFHDNLCKGPKKVTATGVVTEKDGKKMFAVTEMKLAE